MWNWIKNYGVFSWWSLARVVNYTLLPIRSVSLFSTRYQSQFSEVKSSQAQYWNPLSFSRQLLVRVVNDLLIQSVSRFSAKDQFCEVQSLQAHSWKPPSLLWKLLVRVVNDLLIRSVSRFSAKDQFSKVKSSRSHFWKPPSLLSTVTRASDKWLPNTECVTIFYKDQFNEVQSSQAHFWKPPSLFSTVTRARSKWPPNTECVTIFYKDQFNEVQSSQAHFWKPSIALIHWQGNLLQTHSSQTQRNNHSVEKISDLQTNATTWGIRLLRTPQPSPLYFLHIRGQSCYSAAGGSCVKQARRKWSLPGKQTSVDTQYDTHAHFSEQLFVYLPPLVFDLRSHQRPKVVIPQSSAPESGDIHCSQFQRI